MFHLPICLHVAYRKIATNVAFKMCVYAETQYLKKKKKEKRYGLQKRNKTFKEVGMEKKIKKK